LGGKETNPHPAKTQRGQGLFSSLGLSPQLGGAAPRNKPLFLMDN
jgi:hypothetical protein